MNPNSQPNQPKGANDPSNKQGFGPQAKPGQTGVKTGRPEDKDAGSCSSSDKGMKDGNCSTSNKP